MPTQSVTSGCAGHLQEIADALAKAKKVVVVTGAGISTNLGIPDFRSENGLYSLIQAQYDAAAAEKEKAEREELKRASMLQNLKSRSSSPNRASASEQKSTTSTRLIESSTLTSAPPVETTMPTSTRQIESSTTSTRPIETFTIKTRSRTTFEEQDKRIFTRSRSDLTNSRRQTLDNPDTLLRRTSSFGLRISRSNQRNSSVARSSATLSDNTTRLSTTSSPIITESTTALITTSSTITTGLTTNTSKKQSIKRSRSLESLPSSNSIPQRTSKRIKLLYSTPPSSNTSKEASPVLESPEPSSSQSSVASTTRAVLPKLKGRDLFDSMVWADPLTTAIFLTFIAELRKKIRTEVIGTAQAHKLIKAFRDGGRLVRCYTQNIDGLEAREGLNTSLEDGAGRRSRFFSSVVSKPRPEPGDPGGGDHSGGVEIVQLHGGLDLLRCSLCSRPSSWERRQTQSDGEGRLGDDLGDGRDDYDDQPDREATLRGGRAPGCQRCIRADEARQHRGRRSVAVGKLRPDVVLYGEEHPEAARIGELVTHDLSLGPDVILIMGTSLRVHGLKVMVKEFARAAHAKGGKVVFVNNTKPPESTWGDILDWWIEMDCDKWVLDLKDRRPDIWLPQGLPAEPNKSSEESNVRRQPDSKSMSAPKTKNPTTTNASEPKVSVVKRPQCQREDELNGAYWAYQIQLNLEIIGGRPRTYAPNCNPHRKWGHEKWRRDSGRINSSASTPTSTATALKTINTNVPRPAKASNEKQSDVGTARAARSQLQRELSASVGPVSRSSLLLPTPPPSDETDMPEASITTPRTKERIKVASSIERILSSPAGKKKY